MSPRPLYHLAKADFLERVRRYSFLVVLAGAVFLGYELAVGNLVLCLGKYRGIYNSAWVGMLAASWAALFLPLVGFYIVKNTIERDRQTRVGEILAATPMSKMSYLLGKFLSNLAVLGAILVVLLLSALAMQMIKGEERQVQPWPLIAPFLLIALPAVVVAAAAAVLLESVPITSAGFGNILYFFAFIFLLTYGLDRHSHRLDLVGVLELEESFTQSLRAQVSDYDGGMSFTVKSDMPRGSKTFRWEGVRWTPRILQDRLTWFAIALLLVLLATVCFDRFDHAPGARARRRRPARAPADGGVSIAALNGHSAAHLTPIASRTSSGRFGAVLRAELKLMLKGQRWWWYLAALGLLIAGLAADLKSVREIVLPLTWLWPVLIWSAMGVRESRYQTGELIFSSARSLSRQLPAIWVAGLMLAALTGATVGLRFLLLGRWDLLLGWCTGALFIPSLALALGVIAGNARPFEATYLLAWYIGPINGEPALNFMGTRGPAPGVLTTYLALALALFVVALAARRWQMRR
jgi:hypothetical protein